MENMLDISKEAFPNPALSRLSSVLHESESATQRGIDRAFPASLTGLAEHAKRGHNAEDLLDHLETGDYPHLTPEEVSPLVDDPVRTARIAASGEGFLAQIFGSKLDEVVDLVAHQAGVSRTSAHVILGLSAPLLLDALRAESSERHLDAEGLSRFLSEQEERAHDLLPGIVDSVVSATAAKPMPIQAGRDVAARPFFAGGPSAAAYSAGTADALETGLGVPASDLHVHARTSAAPTLDVGVEESFAEPSKWTRALWWVLGAIALIGLISWGLTRLAPKPRAPETPALPRNVGAAVPQPAGDQSAATSLPGGVRMVAPSEAATEAAISAAKPSVVPQASTVPSTPGLPEMAPNVTGGVARRSARDARLAGEEAVQALTRNQPLGPSAASLRSVKPPATDTGIATLGILGTEEVPSVSEAGRTDGIVERQRTNVPQAASGNAIAAYFAGGALPPKRFILRELTFADGSAAVPATSTVLDRAARTLREQPGASVLIEGYADSPQGDARSEGLSKARAESVKRYLVERGVPAGQLKTAGMGDARNMAGESDRRVELVVLTR